MVKDILDGPSGSLFNMPAHISAIGGELFFGAADGSTFNNELWKSDGTEAGTVLVADINPGSASGSDPWLFTEYQECMVFAAKDADGHELWKLGTASAVDGALAAKFRIVPTLSKGTFSIQSGQPVHNMDVLLFDQSGRAVKKWESIPSGQTLDAGEQAQGIYTVQVQIENRSFVKRLAIIN